MVENDKEEVKCIGNMNWLPNLPPLPRDCRCPAETWQLEVIWFSLYAVNWCKLQSSVKPATAARAEKSCWPGKKTLFSEQSESELRSSQIFSDLLTFRHSGTKHISHHLPISPSDKSSCVTANFATNRNRLTWGFRCRHLSGKRIGSQVGRVNQAKELLNAHSASCAKLPHAHCLQLPLNITIFLSIVEALET